ncbi:MAG: hypothetical protein IPK16_25290 [Anaerolineales bacterium]|nr:hypothetical protein [Anaerolineales bacterium]
MPLLLLIDGHSQAYRAYFGMKTPLSTRDGEPTAAVYGFARKLLSTLRDYQPDYVAVALDTGDTWRHAEFPAYKATRESMPDDMRTQMKRIEELLHTFKIPVITYENFEADDILGTLAKQAAALGTDVLIMTGDRDMFQLVDERVKILYTSGGPNPVTSVYGLAEVHDRYALTPQQFIDYKALVGDNSDNIPGVPGVGEKTAIKYLQQFGSLDELYAHLDEISGAKSKQSLIDAKEQVTRNRRLVTIQTDLDLVYEADKCRTTDYSRDAVVELFNALEFKSLIKELPAPDPLESPPAAPEQLPTDAPASGQMALFGELTGAPADLPVPTNAGDYWIVQDEETFQRLLGGPRRRNTPELRCRNDEPGPDAGNTGRPGPRLGARRRSLHPGGPRHRPAIAMERCSSAPFALFGQPGHPENGAQRQI